MTTDKGAQRKANYEVKRGAADDVDSLDRESTRDTEDEVDPSSKTHVVWNFDQETAVNEGWKKKGETSYRAAEKFEDVPREPGSEERRSVRGEELKSRFVEVYEMGSRIEYYSRTQGKWVAGVVDGPGIVNPWSDLPVYEVTIGVGPRKQLRAGVELNLLRFPLRPADPVEVYNAKTKSWFAGSVDKEQSSATLLGYQVKVMEGPEQGIVQVSASSVRPRFPEECVVEVYLPGEGWVQGDVVSEHGATSRSGPDSRELKIAPKEGGKLVTASSHQVRFFGYARQLTL